MFFIGTDASDNGVRELGEAAAIPARLARRAALREHTRRQPVPHVPRLDAFRLPSRTGHGLPQFQRGKANQR